MDMGLRISGLASSGVLIPAKKSGADSVQDSDSGFAEFH